MIPLSYFLSFSDRIYFLFSSHFQCVAFSILSFFPLLLLFSWCKETQEKKEEINVLDDDISFFSLDSEEKDRKDKKSSFYYTSSVLHSSVSSLSLPPFPARHVIAFWVQTFSSFSSTSQSPPRILIHEQRETHRPFHHHSFSLCLCPSLSLSKRHFVPVSVK